MISSLVAGKIRVCLLDYPKTTSFLTDQGLNRTLLGYTKTGIRQRLSAPFSKRAWLS